MPYAHTVGRTRSVRPSGSLRQDARAPHTSRAERRTLVVAAIAALTMVAEIGGGLWFRSMAVVADGLHMASHVLAMGIAVFAYGYARRYATSPRFAFGTGKVNALGGYTGALMLAAGGAWMTWTSLAVVWPAVPPDYDAAIAVAAGGLLVNVVSAWLLRDDPDGGGAHAACTHAHDHNLRAAYLHVVADAVTSLLAILALVVGRAFHLPWLDPIAGAAGGLAVIWWSIGLLRASSSVLLDHQGPPALQDAIRRALADDEPRIADLRCWAVAPDRYAVTVCLADGTSRPVADHKRALARDARVAWTAIEVLS